MSVIEWIAVFSNVASIFSLLLTLKQYNMKAFLINPYTKVFGASIIFTALVFLIPWKRIHIDSETSATQIIVKHNTILKQAAKDGSNFEKAGKKKLEILKPKVIYVPTTIIAQPKTILKDTVQKSSKYTFTAPVTQSAIGDNAAVTNNNYGTKQRHFNDALSVRILLSIPNKDLKISLETYDDEESENYGSEIYDFLISKGYKNITGGIFRVLGRPFYGEVKIIKLDTLNKILVYPAKNSNN